MFIFKLFDCILCSESCMVLLLLVLIWKLVFINWLLSSLCFVKEVVLVIWFNLLFKVVIFFCNVIFLVVLFELLVDCKERLCMCCNSWVVFCIVFLVVCMIEILLLVLCIVMLRLCICVFKWLEICSFVVLFLVLLIWLLEESCFRDWLSILDVELRCCCVISVDILVFIVMVMVVVFFIWLFICFFIGVKWVFFN